MSKIINVSSEKQSGGTTSGIVNLSQDTINTYIWKGRKEGFFYTLGLAIVVEIIIRLIF